MVLPSTINGNNLGPQEWRDALFLRYDIDLTDLPGLFDGCISKFTLGYALDCKKGGFVVTSHSDFCDGVADLASKAFNPLHVHGTPHIHAACSVQGKKAMQAKALLGKGHKGQEGDNNTPPEEDSGGVVYLLNR